jgi:hypothetical protein
MHNLSQRVPRSFVEHNEEWTQLFEPNSNLLRWNKKGSGLFASCDPNSLYCELSMEQEEPSYSLPDAFRFSNNQDEQYGSTIPGVDDLRPPTDMFARFLGQHDQSSNCSSDIRKYLSSAYLNPKSRLHMTNFRNKSRTNFRRM